MIQDKDNIKISSQEKIHRLTVYRKIIVEQTLRELHFYQDVVDGRSQARGDFTDKLLNIAFKGIQPALELVPVGGGIAVSELIDSGLTSYSQNRHLQRYCRITQRLETADWLNVTIILEQVAREAAYSYEWAITLILADDHQVALFAKVGVERMLEYVARNNLWLCSEHLLKGLIEGRSGGYVQGFKNTTLTASALWKELWTKVTQKSSTKLKLTAEGIYARSAYKTPDQRLWLLPKNQHHSSFTPYTKFMGSSIVPKYSYRTVAPVFILSYSCQAQEMGANSPLAPVLRQHPSLYYTVTAEDLSQYHRHYQALQQQCFLLDFIQQHLPHVKIVRCDNVSFKAVSLNWQKADFSEIEGIQVDFSECDLRGAFFKKAYLPGANLQQSHAEAVSFEAVDLSQASLNSANLTRANLNQAKLRQAQCSQAILTDTSQSGTDWYLADLAEVIDERVTRRQEVTVAQEAKQQLAFLSHLKQQLQSGYLHPNYIRVQLLEEQEKDRALTLEDIYVNLAIVKEDPQNQREAALLSKKFATLEQNLVATEQQESSMVESDVQRLGLLDTYENIYRPKEPILLEQLFKAREISDQEETGKKKNQGQSAVPQKLLLLGRAGIGKSTLCRYLAYQWACGKLLQEFDWLFHIDLKQLVNKFLKEHSANITIQQILHAFYWRQWDIPEAQSNELWAIIKEQKILFILDGYDEIAHLQHPLIEEVLLTRDYYLLTSRPYTAQPQRGKVDEILENIGLTSENIRAYIDKYFYHHDQDESIATHLKTWLSHQRIIHSLCAIPLYIELLCNIWITDQQQLQAQNQLQAIDLYERLVAKLLQRMLLKLGYQDKNEQWQLQAEVIVAESFLGRLAFQGLQQGQLLIPGNIFEQCYHILKKEMDATLEQNELTQTNLIIPVALTVSQEKMIKKELKRVLQHERRRSQIAASSMPDLLGQLLTAGFLKNIGVSKNLLKNSYYFLHLSFQEYFSALHLAYHLESEKSSIAEHKYDPTWQLTWTMVAGLLKNDPLRLNHFFELLLNQPRDLYGLYEVIILVECLEACDFSWQLTYRQKFITYLQEWLKAVIKRGGLQSFVASLARLPRVVEVAELVELCLTVAAGHYENYRSLDYRESAIAILTQWLPPLGLTETFSQFCQDPNVKKRHTAAIVLSRLPNPQPLAINAFLEASQDQDPHIRVMVVHSLENFSKSHRELTYPILQRYLQYPYVSQDVETAAIYLAKLSDPTQPEIDLIIQAFQHKNIQVHGRAIMALGKLANPTLDIIHLLLQACRDKVRYVGGLGVNPLSFLQIVLTIKNREELTNIESLDFFYWTVLIAAVKAVTKFFSQSPSLVVTLLNAQKSYPIYQRVWTTCVILTAIVQVLNPSDELTDVLLQAGKDQNVEIRQFAIRAMGELEQPTPAMIELVFEAHKKQNVQIRDVLIQEATLTALGNWVDNNAAALAIILSTYQNTLNSRQTRLIALHALQKLSHLNAEVVEALLQACQDKTDVNTRKTAAVILENALNANETVVAALLRLCQEKNSPLRLMAIALLWKLENPSTKVINVLYEVSELLYWDLYLFVTSIRKGQVNATASMVQILSQAYQDKNPEIRYAGMHALATLENLNPEGITILIQACKDRDNHIRGTAINALLKISNLEQDDALTVMQCLQDKNNLELIHSDNILHYLIFVKRWNFLFSCLSFIRGVGTQELEQELQENVTAVIKVEKQIDQRKQSYFRFFVNKQFIEVSCNDESLSKVRERHLLKNFRYVPMLEVKQNKLGFFKIKKSSTQEEHNFKLKFTKQ